MIVNTFRSPWYKGRADGWVTANDTALTASTSNWNNRVTTKIVEVPIGANGIVSAFIGGATDAGDPDGDTFTCKIYTYAEKGWAELVYDVDCTVGKLQALQLPDGTSLSANGGKFVDTMTSGDATYNSTRWMTEVGLANYSGQDGISVLAFDGLGAHSIYYVISAITANLKVYPIFKVY
jgi:hypothetical protein